MNTLFAILLTVVLSAHMDSTEIWIGQQTALHLEVTTDEESVLFPVLGDQLVPGIAILDRLPIDTLSSNGKTIYRQDLLLTSYNDSLFYVQGIPFLVNGDTLYTAPLSLNVIQPFELDTTDAITDIKPQLAARGWYWGIVRWMLLVLLILLLAAGGYALYRWWEQKRNKAEEAIDPELLRPCDEVALEKLNAIREEKAWTDGRNKEYFSDLTFVVREYIGRRYNIHSTQKTSDETLEAMQPILAEADQRDLHRSLTQMLRLADLVKFAKWTPLQEESEQALRTAYTFVNETKEEVVLDTNQDNQEKQL